VSITPGGDVPGLPPSSTMLSSMAIYSDYGRDVYAIVSTSWRDSLMEACVELSIKEVIDGDLDCASLYHGPHEVYLRFLLFGPSMPAYLPVWLPMLLDVSRNSIRDGVAIGGETLGWIYCLCYPKITSLSL
jgi:hypothetical protein